jgi:iron complex transport system substrate-binding protein
MKARLACLLLLAGALFAEPRRIISTAPSITEMLYALGLGDRVVGVTTYCKYPAEAATKPKIGTYIQPNLEAILALRPDLVVIQTNPIQLRAKLERLGLRVLEVGHDNVQGVYDSIAQIGGAAGVPQRAKALDESLRAQLASIRDRVAKLPQRRVMIVVGRAPGRLEDIIAVGQASYLNDIVQIAGGTNVFRDAVSPYPKVGMEEILARNPEAIVDMGEMGDTNVTDAHRRAIAGLWNKLSSIDAVRKGRVFAIAPEAYTIPGPRMVEAARAFARMLHPEARW